MSERCYAEMSKKTPTARQEAERMCRDQMSGRYGNFAIAWAILALADAVEDAARGLEVAVVRLAEAVDHHE